MLESGILEFIGVVVLGWIAAVFFVWLLGVLGDIESKKK